MRGPKIDDGWTEGNIFPLEGVLYLPFEENAQSGWTTARDLSGNGNDGTVSGADYVFGKYGRALQFVSANSDKVTIPHDASLSLSGSFTIECWIKTSMTPTTWKGIITKKGGGIVNYNIWFGSDYKVHFEIYDGTNNPSAESNSTLNMVIGITLLVFVIR